MYSYSRQLRLFLPAALLRRVPKPRGLRLTPNRLPPTQPIPRGPTMQHQDTQMNDDDVLPFDDEDDQNQVGSHGVLPLEGENARNGIYLIEPRMMSGPNDGTRLASWLASRSCYDAACDGANYL